MEVGEIVIEENGNQLKVTHIETDENGNQIIKYEPYAE